jgi:acetone carboxylase, gamma subunit
MAGYDRSTLEHLLDGTLAFSEVRAIMSGYKDPDRFAQMIAIHQDRVAWDDRILLPYAENLYIVETATGERIVRCTCGHDFGDYRVNWKLAALVFVRDTQALVDEIYPKMMGSDPEWMELREFYCPTCRRQLEVEAVPPGYPIVFDFEPDLEALYRDWIGTPLREQAERP